jgi:hypothetical protein
MFYMNDHSVRKWEPEPWHLLANPIPGGHTMRLILRGLLVLGIAVNDALLT